jgi:hypothetical protein
MHYMRIRIHGDPSIKLIRDKGQGYIDRGYLRHKINGKSVLAHRMIMEEHIGRKLLSSENVHHINGNTLDNSIDNLELWNKMQPCGQRPKDKVKYAIEILSLYAPEKLSQKAKK